MPKGGYIVRNTDGVGHLNPCGSFQHFEEGEEQDAQQPCLMTQFQPEEQGGRGKALQENDPESKTEQHRLADGAHGSRRHECTSGDRGKRREIEKLHISLD